MEPIGQLSAATSTELSSNGVICPTVAVAGGAVADQCIAVPCETSRTWSLSVSPSFTVRTVMSDHFKALALIQDNSKRGVVVNYFRASSANPAAIKLGHGGQRIFDSPNAGGNSVWSEALSFDVLEMLFGAKLKLTEMEIEYFPMGGKITDYSVSLFATTIGVSVTRALKFKGHFCEEDGMVLLGKKLYGIQESSRLVIDSQRWKKQILHVWAENQHVADTLKNVWLKMDAALTGNTVVVITVTEHNAQFIF